MAHYKKLTGCQEAAIPTLNPGGVQYRFGAAGGTDIDHGIQERADSLVRPLIILGAAALLYSAAKKKRR